MLLGELWRPRLAEGAPATSPLNNSHIHIDLAVTGLWEWEQDRGGGEEDRDTAGRDWFHAPLISWPHMNALKGMHSFYTSFEKPWEPKLGLHTGLDWYQMIMI